jgi:hypothetical protein
VLLSNELCMLRNTYINSTPLRLLRMMNNQLSLLPGSGHLTRLVDIEALSDNLETSLTDLTGKRVFFRSDFSKESVPLQNLESNFGTPAYEAKKFAPTSRERQIIAIDSSSVLIGETEDGSIYAGRVAIVSASKNRIRAHFRAGPIIFYINQKSLSKELDTKLPRKVLKAILSDISIAERFIRIKLERSAQIQVARTNSDALILVDGSLRASVLETGSLSLRELERSAEENFNQLVGFSKTSNLKFVCNAAGILQNIAKSEVYFDITDTLRVFAPSLENRVLVAKFSQNSQVFRLDLSRSNAEEDSQVLADLKHNDCFFRGYPETLRLAHHLSVFDSFTVSSTRSFLSKKFGLVRIPSDDLRATILGKLV